MTTKIPKAPAHLAPDTARWWRLLVGKYAFDSHHLRLLQAAAEAWDLKEKARQQVAAEGLTAANRFGELRPHPAVAIERDARTAFARLVRELALADEDIPDNRPPRLSGYQGRA